jgi:hypothetical protein
MKPIPLSLVILAAGCSQTPSVGTTSALGTVEGAVCYSRTDVGDCGQAPLYKDDGTPCPSPWGTSTNTCHQLTPGGSIASVLSCSTVAAFHPEFVGHVNKSSSPNCDQPGYLPCTVDTGWFATLDECCLGSGVIGATKVCCQVADGQSPASCDTPCGRGGKKGCAPCTAVSGGVNGSCTIAVAPVENNDCQGDVGQFSETITVESADAVCISSADDDEAQ